MSDTDRDAPQAPIRVAELKDKVQQATELIGELRETNYSLSAELAELKRELEARPERASGPPSTDSDAADAEASAEPDEELVAELEALRKQRQTIRKKVALLLKRIEKLET